MANSIDQNKKFSVMWPTKEDRKKITSFDSIFILRFTSTYYHLLGTNNKRFHIIIAWCSLVMYGLFDPLELEKLNATSEVNLLPWLSSNLADRYKWIPFGLVVYGNYEENFSLRLKFYLNLLFRDTFRSKYFTPMRTNGNGIYLTSKLDDTTVDDCFGMAAPPSYGVEINETLFEELSVFKYPGLFIMWDNDNNKRFYMYCGPSTLAVNDFDSDSTIKKHAILISRTSDNLESLYYNVERLSIECDSYIFDGDFFSTKSAVHTETYFTFARPEVIPHTRLPIANNNDHDDDEGISVNTASSPTEEVQHRGINCFNGSIISEIILIY